jgi:hypothetical protein
VVKTPFRLNKVTGTLVAVFLGLLLLGASKCSAEPVLTFEAGYTAIRASTPGARLTVEWPQGGSIESFQCGLTLIGPYDFKGIEYPNQGIVDCLVVTAIKRLELGIGPAYLQNVGGVNGSHFNFSLMARWRFNDHHSLLWRHWSNAGTVLPNYGRDLVTYAYSF